MPNIAQRFHHALFEGLFSTEHLHPRRAGVIVDRAGMQELGGL